jgi:hypothetical protein
MVTVPINYRYPVNSGPIRRNPFHIRPQTGLVSERPGNPAKSRISNRTASAKEKLYVLRPDAVFQVNLEALEWFAPNR